MLRRGALVLPFSRRVCLLVLVLLLLLPDPAVAQQRAGVLHQVTGPMQTNTYLLYDPVSRAAALIDPGGPADSLLAAIDSLGLRVKYIFVTHAHSDQVQGVPALRARFPGARWGVSGAELEDMAEYARFAQLLPAEEVAAMQRRMAEVPELAEMMTFDFARLGTPDLILADGQHFPLGRILIRTLLSPGHSRGSICFHVGDILFSGDVLFRGTTGRTDLPGSGGFEAMQASVLRLYRELPDSTRVLPGHGPFTDIGTEKAQNRRVRLPGASGTLDAAPHGGAGLNAQHGGTAGVAAPHGGTAASRPARR
jgi:hydroxyacylglutathione hydrolase